MPNLNRVILCGHLTRDPELRYTTNNTAVCNLGLAINRKWKNQQGEAQEEATFVDCEAWGRTAEIVNEYCRKGHPLLVEGRLKLDQWEDREGQKRSKLKVVIESMQLLSASDDSDRAAPRQSSTQKAGATRSEARPQSGGSSGEHEPVTEDNIPF